MVMGKESYTQMTVKFPSGKERYRQAVECINGRDRSKYRTQADYIAAAVLYFEGSLADEKASLNRIVEMLQKMDAKMEMFCHGKTES